MVERTERILWLMANPDATLEEYVRKWESSRSAYFRDKRYIEIYLNHKYKVVRK